MQQLPDEYFFKISRLRSISVDVKIRNKLIEIEYCASDGRVIKL